MFDDRFPRVVGHLRSHGVAYAALVVAFSFSPVPSMAADLVTTDEIASQAVTRAKLADNSVNSVKVVNDSLTNADIRDGSVNSADVANGALKGEDLNLFNDDQCTGETVQGTATINTDKSVPYAFTTDWVGYGHSCSGEPVMVSRETVGQYVVSFGASNPARLAVVSSGVSHNTVSVTPRSAPGTFRVHLTFTSTGSPTDFGGFSILVY